MDSGVLSLRFSEPVNRSSLVLGAAVLQTEQNQVDAEAYLRLRTGGARVLPVPCKDTIYATQPPSSLLPPTPAPSFNITPSSAPTLSNAPSVSFSPTLTSLAPTNQSYWTICDNYTTVEDSLWLNVSLGAENLNTIKATYPLATREAATWLALAGTVATDRAGNGALTQFWTIYEGHAPAVWVGDVTPPELESFAIDMDAGELDLTFSETVNANELDVTCIYLQETGNNQTGGLVHQLRAFGPVGARTGGTLVTSGDGPTLTVKLSRADLDEVKRKPRLCTALATTFVAMDGPSCYRDNAFPPNYGDREKRNRAMAATRYTPDTTRPTLTGGALDLDGPFLTLEFDETVNASSLDVDAVSAQSTSKDAAATERVTLHSYVVSGLDRGSGRSSPAASNVTIALGARDFAAMKLATLFGQDPASTYFAALPGAILDMANNRLVEAGVAKAIRADNGVRLDERRPSLEAFTLDLDSGVLGLQFDEPVTRASLEMSKVSLSASKDPDADRVTFANSGTEFLDYDHEDAFKARRLLRLRFSPVTTSVGSEVLYARLSRDDLNALKIAEAIGISQDTTLLLASSGFVADSGTANPGVRVTRKMASNFSNDVTRPLLASATIDLDAGTLILTADEPVRRSTANASFFKLSARPDGGGRGVLVGAMTDVAPDAVDAVSLEFHLDCETLDAIKVWAPKFAYISHAETHFDTGGGLVDMYGNALAPINGSKNTSAPVAIVQDATPPRFLGFDWADANVTLRFDEPVDPYSLITVSDAWALQPAASAASGETFLRLRGDGNYRRTVSAGLSKNLRTAIAADGGVATEQSNTYLRVVQTGAATDVQGNPLVGPGSALQLGPRVLKFGLDMDAGALTVDFSEPVDAATFDAAKLTLQAASALGGLTEALALSSTTSKRFSSLKCDPRVSLGLTDSDVERLRFMSSLSRGTALTYLVAGPDAAEDEQHDALVELLSTDAMPAAIVYPDVTRPIFKSCALDMDSSELTMTFDEPVRAGSFDATRVELRDAEYSQNSSVSVQLTGASTVASDAYAIVVALGTRDEFAIKSSAPVGQTYNGTWCGVRSDCVTDCGAGLASGANGNLAGAERVSTLVTDATKPTLEAFNLDLDSNTLVLMFDEPVNTSSVNPVSRAITLTTGPSTTATSVALSCSTVPSGLAVYNSTVPVELCGADFNAIFSVKGLCRTAPSCWLSHAYALAEDAASPPNIAVSRVVEGALEATAILPDVTPPSITSFGLDLDAGSLTLAFDEVVQLNTLDVDTITLQSAKFNDYVGTRALSAENGTALVSGDFDNDTDLTVALGRDDLDAIKALGGVGLALGTTSTYLSHAAGLIADVSGNRASEKFAYSGYGPAANWTADTTPPKLVALEKISSTKKILYARFDEPVDHEAANLSLMALSLAEDGSLLRLNAPELAVEILSPTDEADAGVRARGRYPNCLQGLRFLFLCAAWCS